MMSDDRVSQIYMHDEDDSQLLDVMAQVLDKYSCMGFGVNGMRDWSEPDDTFVEISIDFSRVYPDGFFFCLPPGWMWMPMQDADDDDMYCSIVYHGEHGRTHKPDEMMAVKVGICETFLHYLNTVYDEQGMGAVLILWQTGGGMVDQSY